jgi:hypothetical protein
METHKEATRLLNIAQTAAVWELAGEGGINATPENLAELARLVRKALLLQVELGLWRAFGIGAGETAKIAPVVVTTRFGNKFTEPPVVVDYDFSRTSVPLLRVRSVPRGGVDASTGELKS